MKIEYMCVLLSPAFDMILITGNKVKKVFKKC